MSITRRTAIKAIGAALMAPCVQLRPHIARERLLRAFCDPITEYETRYGRLDVPFLADELTYATDARYIVRTKIDTPHFDGERRIPPVQSLYEREFKPKHLVRFHLPHWSEAKLSRLPGTYCEGYCPECSGRRISCGDTYPPEDVIAQLVKYGYDVDDNSIRDRSCQLCKGLHYDGPWVMDVCGVPMDYSRLKPIAALPDVMVCGGVNEQGSILFVADGCFEGMAMGLVIDETGQHRNERGEIMTFNERPRQCQTK